MKLEVKYLLSTSSSVANFYIYQFSEGLRMRKILAHGRFYDAKESTNQDGHFLDFHEFSRSNVGSRPNLHHRMKISSMGVTNPEIVYS